MGYFILGILLCQIISPLIDGIASLLLTMIEVAKGYFSIKVAKYNKQMKKITFEDEEVQTRQIGFSTEIFEEEEEDYEEDE